MENKIDNKKSVVDLTDLAIGIIVLGTVATVGATILINTRDAKLTDLPTYQTVNESFTLNNGTATSLTNKWVQSIQVVTNASDATVISTGNYTSAISSVDGTGTITGTTGSEFDGGTFNVNYTYYDTTQADYALANDAATGLAEYGNWFKIIVIVGVAAVVLSLIFMAFGGRGSGSGSMSY